MGSAGRSRIQRAFGRFVLLALTVALVLGGAYLASVLTTQKQPVARKHAPSPTPKGMPVTATPTPRPSSEPEETPEVAAEGNRITVHESSATLPWPTDVPPTAAVAQVEEHRPPARAPTPTPSVAQCVGVSWSASMSAAAPGQVLVEITATNYCDRSFAPPDLWFLVSGYHHDALVRSVTGHPFDPLPRGGSVVTTIGLPGSIDWYDRIAVQTFWNGG
jgi:hypothetical protein